MGAWNLNTLLRSWLDTLIIISSENMTGVLGGSFRECVLFRIPTFSKLPSWEHFSGCMTFRWQKLNWDGSIGNVRSTFNKANRSRLFCRTFPGCQRINESFPSKIPHSMGPNKLALYFESQYHPYRNHFHLLRLQEAIQASHGIQQKLTGSPEETL